MTPPKLQSTRFELLLGQLVSALVGNWRGTWRRRSLGLLALLVGLYAGNNLTAYYLQMVGHRPVVVLIWLLVIEFVVRLRSRLVTGDPSLAWVVVDNLRIGLVYAVVLEAFKLGS
jgi:hypothetical protein